MEQTPPFPLTPACFVDFVVPCKALTKPKAPLTKSYLLPHEVQLLDQRGFADVSMGWCAEGIRLQVHVHQPWEKAVYPELQQGDSVELFIDTRDRKQGGLHGFAITFSFRQNLLRGCLQPKLAPFAI